MKRNSTSAKEEKLSTFDVPTESPNVSTHYKVLKQSQIGKPANFKIKYQADCYPFVRKRYTNDLASRLQKLK